MKILSTLLTLSTVALVLAFPALAAAPVPATPAYDIVVKVDGLVCDFCSRAIKKVLSKRAEVISSEVSLNDRTVSIDLKDGQTLSDDDIASMITDAGYTVVTIDRKQAGS